MKKLPSSIAVLALVASPALAQDYASIPANVRMQVSQKCANRWTDDYSMRAYCVKKDLAGYLELQQLSGQLASPEPTPSPGLARGSARAVFTATPASNGVYYPNCSAARAAGAAPIRIGEPGYARKLDRDGDGVACE